MSRNSLIPKELSTGLLRLTRKSSGKKELRDSLEYRVNMHVYAKSEKHFVVPMPRIHNHKHYLHAIRATRHEAVAWLEQFYIDVLRQQAEIPEAALSYLRDKLKLSSNDHIITDCRVYRTYVQVAYIDVRKAKRKKATVYKTRLPGEINLITRQMAMFNAKGFGYELMLEDFIAQDGITAFPSFVLDEGHLVYYSDCVFTM